MTSILEKLKILGVRSFGATEHDEANIVFETPLTLILGHNGCGKTTIIESLKFAATGDQPPNAKSAGGGSGFVHDPKRLKASEVRAQVKLMFTDINNLKSTVTRSMVNKQSLKKVTFKTLDATIRTVNEFGVVEDISHRCADADQTMAYLLGVSKPILNYVIFCHQEESCWPMEEGKKLKERFDEIFDSAKYNKCMDNIRKIKKEKMTEISKLKKEKEHLEVIKREADIKIKKLNEEETRMMTINDSITKFEAELREVDKKKDVVQQKEINIASIITVRDCNIIKLEELKKAIKEILTGLRGKEFQGSDENLDDELRSFEKNLTEREDEISRLDKEIKKMVDAEKNLQSRLSSEQNNLGGLKHAIDANKSVIQNRNEILNKLAQEMKLSAMVSPFSETQVSCLTESIDKKLRDIKRDIDKLKFENINAEKVLQTNIDGLREDKTKLEQIKKIDSEKLESTKKELDKLKTEIDEISQSTKNLTILDNKLKRVNKELEDQMNSVNINDLDNSIKEMQRSRDSMEEELVEINKEVDDLIECDKLQSKLDNCVDRKVVIEEEISRLKSKNDDAFKHLFGKVPDHNFSQHLNLALSRLVDKIRTSQADINGKRQALTRLEANQQHIEDKLRNLNETLSNNMSDIEDVCGNGNYEIILSETISNLQITQDEKGTLKASNFLFDTYIKKLNQPDPCCPLCKRKFEEENGGRKLAHELSSRLKDIPVKMSTVSEEQERLSNKLQRLHELKPVNDRVISLQSTEIPTLSKELSVTKEKLVKLREELTDLENDLMLGAQADEHMARSVQSDTITIDQKQNEIDALQSEIEELQNKIPASGKTLQQAKNERDQLQFDLDNKRKKIDSLQSKKVTHNDQMNKLQNTKNDIIKEQLRVQTGKQKEKQLLDKQDELKELKNNLALSIEDASNKILPVVQKLEQAIRDKDEAFKKHASSIDTEVNKLTLLERKSDQARELQNKIGEFERHGTVKKLEQTERSINEIKRDLEGFNQKKQVYQSQKETVNADMANQGTRQRDLHDNRKLRQKRIEEQELQKVVKENDEKIGALDLKTIKRERMELQSKFEELNREKHQAQGKKNELANSISSLRNEMKKSLYRDAAKSFIEKAIQLRVEEVTSSDIDMYYGALDSALKTFHAERMKAINIIIKHLWRTIYRGHDIDYIEIRCDVETTTSAEKRRVYNYKVMQIKDDSALEMRGRCSAGQKMLASIIIRMALAETFSNNCGIMTLDEPTTNLDRNNIESLSQAIVEIVTTQTETKAFQLVVITHDEEFLMRLSKMNKVNHFWKVYKNDDGLSRVQQCPID